MKLDFFKNRRSRTQQATDAVTDAISGAFDLATTGQLENLNAIQKMSSTLSTLFVMFAMVIFVFAGLFAVFEHTSYWDGIWWAVVTATSTGYGDVYPKSVSGRLAGCGLMLTMIFFLGPILISKWAAKAIVDSDAWTHAEQEELKAHVRHMDAKVDLLIQHLGIVHDLKLEHQFVKESE
jgi:voltage-gated potassium channel